MPDDIEVIPGERFLNKLIRIIGFCLQLDLEETIGPQQATSWQQILAALETFRDHALAVSEAARLIRNQ